MRNRPPAVTVPTTLARTSQRAHTSRTASSDVGLHDREHPLLALRRHDLDGRHGGFPQRHLGHVHVHPVAGARRGLRRRAGEPGTTEVLDPDDEAAVEQLEGRLDEPLLLEGIAHLHARPLLSRRPRRLTNPADARTLTPPIPSLPVVEPRRTARFPTPAAAPRTRRSIGSSPRQSTFTRGLRE